MSPVQGGLPCPTSLTASSLGHGARAASLAGSTTLQPRPGAVSDASTWTRAARCTRSLRVISSPRVTPDRREVRLRSRPSDCMSFVSAAGCRGGWATLGGKVTSVVDINGGGRGRTSVDGKRLRAGSRGRQWTPRSLPKATCKRGVRRRGSKKAARASVRVDPERRPTTPGTCSSTQAGTNWHQPTA